VHQRHKKNLTFRRIVHIAGLQNKRDIAVEARVRIALKREDELEVLSVIWGLKD
jgi:hypothetical protein